MDELKPCPFCGTKKIELFKSHYGYWIIECDCDITTGNHYNDKSAIAEWNTRYLEDKIKAKIEKLEIKKDGYNHGELKYRVGLQITTLKELLVE